MPPIVGAQRPLIHNVHSIHTSGGPEVEALHKFLDLLKSEILSREHRADAPLIWRSEDPGQRWAYSVILMEIVELIFKKGQLILFDKNMRNPSFIYQKLLPFYPLSKPKHIHTSFGPALELHHFSDRERGAVVKILELLNEFYKQQVEPSKMS